MFENCKTGCSKTTYLVLEIVSYLSRQDEFYIEDVLNEFGLDRQAFMRHFKTICVFFKDKYEIDISEKTSQGCFRIINRDVLVQALNFGDKKELLSYIQILHEILPHYYNKLDSKTKKRLSKEKSDSTNVYHFHNNAREKSVSPDILTCIEASILKKRKVVLDYEKKGSRASYANVKPIKIIFMEGNLYLACLTDNERNYGFMFLRIYLIKKYTLLSETFNDAGIVAEAKFFAENFQTPFSIFKSPKTEVVLIVSKRYAKHFLQKKHLSSQKEEKLSDGRVMLTFYVDEYKEIEHLIKKWLPDIHIVQPEKWRKLLHEDLSKYLENHKPFTS